MRILLLILSCSFTLLTGVHVHLHGHASLDWIATTLFQVIMAYSIYRFLLYALMKEK